MAERYLMYGAGFSLYSGKLRSYLRKKGIPFAEKTATARVYRRIIEPRTGVRFIPVLKTPDGRYLQDTTAIIDALEPLFPSAPAYPEGPRQRLAALLLELLGDEWLLMPAMHYRWHYLENYRFIYREFGAMLFPWLPAFAQRHIGRRAGARFRKLVPRLGITERTQALVEQRYLALLDHLQQHFTAMPYLLGDRPTMGDYGFIGPLYAHLYRDPYPGRLMRDRAPAVADWVERMQSAQPVEGDLLPNDAIPDTLLPILRSLCADFLPIMVDLARAVGAWAPRHAGEQLPRVLGEGEFRLDEVVERRVLLPYSLWMFQRPWDAYRNAAAAEQPGLRQFAADIQARDALEIDLPVRLVRRNNRLFVEQ